MKIGPSQYAQILFDLTERKDRLTIDKAVKNFAQLLVKNGHLGLTDRIIHRFSELYNKKHGIVEAEITTRNELDHEILSQVRSCIRKKYLAKEVIIKKIIDRNIKGGIVIKVGDEIIDASLAGVLQELKKRLSE